MSVMSTHMHRRAVLIGLSLATVLPPAWARAQSQPVYAVTVRRAEGCGCCGNWTAHIQRTGRFTATLRNDPDLAGTKRRLGVPDDLVSCHTSEAGGYVIEGHVPVADILRLLSERPRHVRGIAVSGMPLGSPGMEAPGGARQAFDVVAFHADGSRSVYARYAAAP